MRGLAVGRAGPGEDAVSEDEGPGPLLPRKGESKGDSGVKSGCEYLELSGVTDSQLGNRKQWKSPAEAQRGSHSRRGSVGIGFPLVSGDHEGFPTR